MALTIVEDDNRFRLESQYFCTDWVSDTPSNRKAMVVFLRLLRHSSGRALFTHQQLANIVNSSNRQASSHHFESFVACGCDFLDYLKRKRKVNDEVVDAVLLELLSDPLAKISDLTDRVNARLTRNDISEANIKAALESIPVSQIRSAIQGQLSVGEAHYKEQYLLEEMMISFSSASGEKAGIAFPPEAGMKLSDPTAIRCLLTKNAPLSEISNPIKWVIFIMTLYYHGLVLSWSPLIGIGKMVCGS